MILLIHLFDWFQFLSIFSTNWYVWSIFISSIKINGMQHTGRLWFVPIEKWPANKLWWIVHWIENRSTKSQCNFFLFSYEIRFVKWHLTSCTLACPLGFYLFFFYHSQSNRNAYYFVVITRYIILAISFVYLIGRYR